ncbi:MAG: lytic transglycosylase domain-containing protein [Moorellaceae bacterium]
MATVKLRGTIGGIPFDVVGTYFPERSPLAAEAARVEAARWIYAASLASRGKTEGTASHKLTEVGIRNVPPVLDAAFEKAGRKYGVDPDLLRAVAWVESGYDVKAVSPKGATGVMQLMPDTAKARGVTDLFDPAQNIDAGAEYLRELVDAYNGDLELALAAYNAGTAAVERYKGVPPYTETRKYVAAVESAYIAFKKAGGLKEGGNTDGR